MTTNQWWNELFVEGGEVYADVLGAHVDEAAPEAEFVASQLQANGVTPGSLVLDLGCGIGRHAVELAERGYRVTGLDISPKLIEAAERHAEECGVASDTNFAEGDMREASDIFAADQFDAVVNLFSTFGFFDAETNRKVLEEAAAISTADASFVIDTINRDWLMRHFQPNALRVEGEVMTIERRSFDFDEGRSHSKWTLLRPSGEDTFERVLSTEVDMRVYCLHELDDVFEAAGWERVDVFGDLSGADFGVASSRIVGVFDRETVEQGE